MKPVFEYSNYRDFITDYCAYKKALSKHFSNRAFAIQAGFNSSGFLTDVIKGRRNLSDNYIDKFISGMKLEGNDAEYFRLLVKLNQTDLTSERQIFYKKMIEFMPIDIKHVKEDHMEYFSKWHHCAIRESLAIKKINDNYADLANFFITEISVEQITASFELLQRLGLISYSDDDKRWVATSNTLWSDRTEITKDLLRGFQKQVIMQGIEITDSDSCSAEKQRRTTTTMSISKDTLEIIKNKMTEFHREITEIVEVDKNEDTVYQLNMQLFPLSK